MMRRVLVAGVGNVFFGDDGFGVEVAQRLARASLPPGVEVRDFGIRGVHLAFELLRPLDLLIIADAVAGRGAPGALFVIEPDLDGSPAAPQADAHGMDVRAVLASARAMGAALPRVLIVGCEAQDVDERMGLSAAVEQAVGDAVQLVRELLDNPKEAAS